MSNEIELKYAVPPLVSPENILRCPLVSSSAITPVSEISMVSTYFDTADAQLGKLRASVRLRRENDISVVTVKTAKSSSGALSARGEWQVSAENISDALPLLAEAGVPEDILSIATQELCVIAHFSFVRKCVKIKTPYFSAELCVDKGFLSPDGKLSSPLYELELELSDGDVSALCVFGHKLASVFSLSPQPLSKLSRARNLK